MKYPVSKPLPSQKIELFHDDSLEKLKDLEEDSVDSIVTDPPYGLNFMNKHWDYDVPTVELWIECLRVLKPGGYLLSFASSRTQHRMCVNIEDAGFEIRDMIAWVYGSGFPKSHNISKAIDKSFGKETSFNSSDNKRITDDAKKWDGWGTALKPSFEPITVARKPLSEKTVAKNVLKHGTGGINIDDCRVELNGDYKCKANGRPSQTALGDNYNPEEANKPDTQGRFPANLIHDGSEEVEEVFPQNTKSGATKRNVDAYEGESNTGLLRGVSNPSNQHCDSGSASRFFYCAKTSKSDRDEGLETFEDKKAPQRDDGQPYGMNTNKTRPDGSIRKEVRPKKNNHPTVKPTKLMRYLVRLVTPKGGTVLDPFMGSGSTGKACVFEHFDFIGIELEKEYLEIAEARIHFHVKYPVILDKNQR